MADETSATASSLLAQIPYLAQLTLKLGDDVASLRTIAHTLELKMAEVGVATLKIDLMKSFDELRAATNTALKEAQADMKEMSAKVDQHESYKDKATGAIVVINVIWIVAIALWRAFHG